MTTISAETEFVAPALIKPRNPRIARQLAWGSVGMGHMYLGLLVRGLCFMTGTYLPVCLGVLALTTDFVNWIFIASCFGVSILVNAWSIWDAVQCGHQTRADYRLKDYNRPGAYVMFCLVSNLSMSVGMAVVLITFVGSWMRFTGDFWGHGYKNGDQVFYSKLAYRSSSPMKDDRVVFRFIPASKSDTPGLILAVAGESITTNSGTTVVPPDQVWLRYQDNAGKNHDRFVSSYAIGGKIVFRFWPLSRFGKIPTETPH